MRGAPEKRWPFVTPGIPDGWFGESTLLTKEEVRAVVLAKLRLRRDTVLWDVGSGLGSVAVEAALLAPAGAVWAVEKDPQRCRMIEANARRFGVANLRVVPGTAPEALAGLPRPDRIFVGGASGRVEPVLDAAWRALLPEGRLVLVAVTLETLAAAAAWFRGDGRLSEAVCLNVARALPGGPLAVWRGLNPVYVFAADRTPREAENPQTERGGEPCPLCSASAWDREIPNSSR
ncbi:MAG: precorrin-6Y C5,15-methyltransferase (decarboxylating) subunit CbiT [Firmicutes bacterium]|nr:precorrin-6Y C5,15-methyltransferase (decarboxylating) subunit CbiT [Bacillota bacterium]